MIMEPTIVTKWLELLKEIVPRSTRWQNDCDRDRLACSAERIAGDYRALCIWNGADHAQDYTDDCVRSRVDRTGVGSESRD